MHLTFVLTNQSLVLTERTFVYILVAGGPSVPGRTRADGLSAHRVGIAVGALLTRVADARIIQMTQKSCGSNKVGKKTIKRLQKL